MGRGVRQPSALRPAAILALAPVASALRQAGDWFWRHGRGLSPFSDPSVEDVPGTFSGLRTYSQREHRPWGLAKIIDPVVGQFGQYSNPQDDVAKLFKNTQHARAEAARLYPEASKRLELALAKKGDRLAAEAACHSVWDITRVNHNAKPVLAAAGGLEVSLSTLKQTLSVKKRNPEEKRVTMACMQALADMSLYQRDVQDEAGRLGAVEAFVQIQKRWYDDPRMQVGGMQGCFNDFSEANRKRWKECGGLAYNMETLRRYYYKDQEVVLNCWFAFSSGTNFPNEREFVKHGGIVEGMRTMMDHAGFSRTREEVMQAMRALSRCSGCQDIRDQLVSNGFLENLEKAMKEVPFDIHTQAPACSNVAQLTKGSMWNRDRAYRLGLHKLAFKALVDYPRMVSSVDWAFNDQYTVLEDCSEALSSIAQDARAKAYLKKASVNGTYHLREAMKLKPQSGRFQSAVKDILTSLSHW